MWVVCVMKLNVSVVNRVFVRCVVLCSGIMCCSSYVRLVVIYV